MFWTYATFSNGYHAVFSILIPILLTELVFRGWPEQTWLGWADLTASGAVYAVSAAGIGPLLWTFLRDSVYHVPATVNPVQQSPPVALIVSAPAHRPRAHSHACGPH